MAGRSAGALAVAPKPRGGRTARTDDAYRHIRADVLDKRMVPGFQALESEPAARLGMRRTRVREALIRLNEDGLVDVVRRRGMRVLALSPGDMRDIYQVLTCVDS
jgi:DNA-binding GntR family transcriptional regulator